MRKLFILAFMAFVPSAFAGDLALDTVLGTTQSEVRTSLTNLGYEVRKSEMEEGKIEVYFVKDNKMGEVYISVVTGKIIKIEMK